MKALDLNDETTKTIIESYEKEIKKQAIDIEKGA